MARARGHEGLACCRGQLARCLCKLWRTRRVWGTGRGRVGGTGRPPQVRHAARPWPRSLRRGLRRLLAPNSAPARWSRGWRGGRRRQQSSPGRQVPSSPDPRLLSRPSARSSLPLAHASCCTLPLRLALFSRAALAEPPAPPLQPSGPTSPRRSPPSGSASTRALACPAAPSPHPARDARVALLLAVGVAKVVGANVVAGDSLGRVPGVSWLALGNAPRVSGVAGGRCHVPRVARVSPDGPHQRGRPGELRRPGPGHGPRHRRGGTDWSGP